jgi:hypothetical protein
MKGRNYDINLNYLTAGEYFSFRDSFDEYRKAVLYMFNVKGYFIFEDDLVEKFTDDVEVLHLIAGGKQPIEAIKSAFPDKFISAGSRIKKGQEGYTQAWFDLWDEDYIITPGNTLYDLFFTYHLRQADLLELDNLLNYFLDNYSDNRTDFMRFLQLTVRKHGKKLLQPEQIETVNEWMAEQEKGHILSGIPDIKTKGKPKRDRDDKITCLNQEQTALLIYCLRDTKIIFPDEFLNNKEAGHAFSVLTGYSADTIRQNLNKSEVARLATIKNIDAVTKALNDLLKFIENKVKPE